MNEVGCDCLCGSVLASYPGSWCSAGVDRSATGVVAAMGMWRKDLVGIVDATAEDVFAGVRRDIIAVVAAAAAEGTR